MLVKLMLTRHNDGRFSNLQRHNETCRTPLMSRWGRKFFRKIAKKPYETFNCIALGLSLVRLIFITY